MKSTEKQINILVVDDSESTRFLIKTYLLEGGYQVVEATDGKMGLEICRQQPIDLIVLDIHMPVMDGFSLCGKLQNEAELQSIPVIMLSALDDTESKVKSFECGAVDYVSKPVTEGELLARIQSHLSVSQLTATLRKTNRELSSYQQELLQGLSAAADIQKNLLPQRVPDCKQLRFASYFLPSHEVGGDIFNIQRLNSKYLAIYILDVSGHGFSAAIMTALFTQTLSGSCSITRARGKDGEEQVVSPGKVISELNKEFPIARFGHYATIAYLLYNMEDNSFRYCCAGHPPITHVTQSGEVTFLGVGGPPAGLDGVWQEGEGILKSGDRLFFYTDGVIEYRNKAGEMYGKQKLVDSMVDNWGFSLTDATCNIIDTLEEFGDHLDGDDDMALLAVEMK